MVGGSRYRCEVVVDRLVRKPNFFVCVEKSVAISPVEKLPPDNDRPPCVGPSRPERVFTLMTPANLSPNSAGMPPVKTSTVRRVRASRLVEKIADRLSVIGIPSTTYCTCDSE